VATAVAETAERTQQAAFAWSSDGWQGYPAILAHQSRRPVYSGQRGRPRLVVPAALQLPQQIKHRDPRGRLISIEGKAVFGLPLAQPGTVHGERLNGTLRDRLNALTRKTHAFAKCDATWDALLGLPVFEHNWLRPHRALRLPLEQAPQRYARRSPAMALGLTDHIWSWAVLLTTPIPITS
jgi:hypothetical protein